MKRIKFLNVIFIVLILSVAVLSFGCKGGGSGSGEDEDDLIYATISGRVLDAETWAPLPGVTVSIMGDSEESSATTGSDGTFSLTYEVGFGYTIVFTFSGYILAEYSGVDLEGDIFLSQVPLVNNSFSGPGNINGVTKNGVTGGIVPGATVKIRAGINNTSGDVLVNTTSDSSGGFSAVGLNGGNYTAEVSCSGFVTGYLPFFVLGGTSISFEFSIVEIGDEDILIINYTWNGNLADGDLHVTGPIEGSEERFHVFYNNKTLYQGSTLIVRQDVDDTNGWGPENTSIYFQIAGIYKVSIQDYTNRSSTTSNALSLSDSKVNVIRGGRTLATFSVPSLPGTLWEVCEIEGDSIRPINGMSFYADPYTIRGIIPIEDLPEK